MRNFNLTEIDYDAWHSRSIEEANLTRTNKSFKESKQFTNGMWIKRTYDHLVWQTKRGQAAEQFLMTHCGYSDDDGKCRDVRNPLGESVEVKVIGDMNYLESNLIKWGELVKLAWTGWPTILEVWHSPSKTQGVYNPEYKYVGRYHWNTTVGSKFYQSWVKQN